MVAVRRGLAIAVCVALLAWALLHLLSAHVGGGYRRYTEDVFFGIRWRYVKKKPSVLTAYCPTCDTMAVTRLEVEFTRAPWPATRHTLHMHRETCRLDLFASDRVNSYDLKSMVQRQIDVKS